mgnify:FL=1
MDLDIVLDNDKRFISRCAAIIYNKDKTKVLMFSFKNYYMLPGGRIEFNETSLDAIKREIKEETGYDLKFTFQGVQENFLRKDNKDIMQYVFLYETIYDGDTSSFVSKDNESQIFTFIDINKLDEYNIVPRSNIDIIKNHKVHTVERENN